MRFYSFYIKKVKSISLLFNLNQQNQFLFKINKRKIVLKFRNEIIIQNYNFFYGSFTYKTCFKKVVL